MTRASDLIGRAVTDGAGHPLGRVVDLVCEGTPPRVTAALVVRRGPWGRLLGYERPGEVRGPWPIERAARVLLRRDLITVPWSALRLAPLPDGEPPVAGPSPR